MNNAKRLAHYVFGLDHMTRKLRYSRRQELPVTEPATKYESVKYFDRERETSPYLNHAMPVDYIQATWPMEYKEASVDQWTTCLIEGMSAVTVPGFADEGVWEYFLGTVDDTHFQAVFVRKGLALTLRDAGLSIDLAPTAKKNTQAKTATAIKRMKRGLAPHAYAAFGEPLEVTEGQHGPVYVYLLESYDAAGDRNIVRISVPRPGIWDDVMDGKMTVSPRGAELLFGLRRPKVGDGFEGTAMGEFGQAKGLGLVCKMKYDACFPGIKTEIHYHGRLFTGALKTSLNVSRTPRSDFQSLINYFVPGRGLGFVSQMLDRFFTDQQEAILTGDRFRRMMLGIVEDKPDTDWVRARASALDLDGCFPGLFRADVAMLRQGFTDAMQGRIPMSGVSKRYYMSFGPWTVDPETGLVDPSLELLRNDEVLAPGSPEGMVAFHRQPNGNCNEHVLAINVDARSIEVSRHIGNAQQIYISVARIKQVYSILGGGDGDDPVIVYFDPMIVEHFSDLPTYPTVVENKPTRRPVMAGAEAALRFVQEYFGTDFNPSVWSMRHLLTYAQGIMSSTKLGTIVNALMLDTLLTIGKASMLKDLKRQNQALVAQLAVLPDGEERMKINARNDRVVAAYKWLKARPDYVLRTIGSNLESRVDAIKMGGGMSNDGDRAMIANMYNSIQVWPSCWSLGGFQGNGRIPLKYVENEEPILAQTQLCELLASIPPKVQAINSAFKQVEWMLVRPLPEQLRTLYPKNEVMMQFVRTIRKNVWNSGLIEARERGLMADPEAFSQVLKSLIKEVSDRLIDSPFHNQREALSVHLAIDMYGIGTQGVRLYTGPQVDENNVEMSVSDALLWTAPFGLPFLNALEKAGLTGKVVRVNNLRHVDYPKVEVAVHTGVVIDAQDGRELGDVIGLENGYYVMENGLIYIKRAHRSLAPGWKLPDE